MRHSMRNGFLGTALTVVLALPAFAEPAEPATDPETQPSQTSSQSATVQAADATTASSDAAADGEIVVTAQRREQRLQDVGIAITAFTGESLRDANVQTSADISRISPGVYQSGSIGGQSTQFSIRGVTQSDFSDVIEAPVAVYIDEGYVPSQQGQTLSLLDVARVELLKGPQGTLFGRNATGGLVSFVINKPTDTLQGFANAGIGTFGEVRVEAAVGGPLASGLSGRVSVLFSRNGDWYDNVYPAGSGGSRPLFLGSKQLSPCCSDLGYQRTIAGRLQLQYETGALTLRAVGSLSDQNQDTPPYESAATIATFDEMGRVVGVNRVSPTETRSAIGPGGSNVPLPFSGTGGVRPVPGGDLFGFRQSQLGKWEVSNDYAANANRVENQTAALHANYDLGWANLTSITDYRRNNKQLLIDIDGTPYNIGVYSPAATTKSWSQEIRLGGNSDALNWVTGIYYLNVNARSIAGLEGPTGSYLASAFGLTDEGVDANADAHLRTKSLSLFGQIDYEFAPRFTFVLGGRVIFEKQKFDYVAYAARNEDDYKTDSSEILFNLFPAFEDKRSQTLWAGKAQLEFRPRDGVLLYAGVNRGVKAGSYNAKLPDGTPPLDPDEIPYKPEVLVAYEAGFKARLARRMYLNASAFYYDYSDYQAYTFVNISGFVQNKDATTYGLDVEFTAEPIEGLRLGLAGSILKATVKNLEFAPGLFRDVRPTYTPTKQFAARASYKIPVDVAKGNFTIAADGNYVGSVYHNIRNFDGDRFPGYFVGNAQLSWADFSDKLSFTAWIKNITDKHYGVIGFDLATFYGGNIEAYGMRRTAGLSASLKL